jgi:hypothetical protein
LLELAQCFACFGEVGGLEGAGGEECERFGYERAEAGEAGEFRCAGFGGAYERASLVGVEGESAAYVGDPELDVASFVSVCEACGCGGRGVWGVMLDEAEQVEEGAFAEDVEQDRCGGEVMFFEQ